MQKILITGGNGQLGKCIQSVISNYTSIDATFTDVEELNICDYDELEAYLKLNPFDFIVNCAAYTAVDKAETEQTAAKKINAEAVRNIGIISSELNIKVIHISTDYVFDGKSYKPYQENELALPESVYGETKLLGEKYLLETNPNSIVIRTSWLYSEFANNFVKTMIRLGKEREELKVVSDQIGSPTYAIDLAHTILKIIEHSDKNKNKFTSGVFHYSNEGICSWYDFTINIHQMMGINCKVLPIESKDYPTAAPRPFYSVLNKNKIKKTYNLIIPYWRDSLEKCLRILSIDN